jgi:molecular chaperone DnaK
MGAAIQAAIIKGEVKDVLLLDVTPLSLGIETLGGVSTKLIERNTTIPTRKSEIFSTAAENQTEVTIRVLQGERPMAGENKSIGRFILDGLLPAPRGMPQVEVTFDIDANGILNVSAKDKGTGREQRITITASSGLSKAEVEKMVRESEAHAEEDKRKREEIETKNQADNRVYQAEKTLREHGEKVGAELRGEIEGKIAAVRSALQGRDAGRMRSTMQELSESLQKMGQAVYGAGQGGGSGPAGGSGETPGGGEQQPPKGEGPVEGEFREV